MPPAPIPFTPPHVSLNRVRVMDLPGIPVDEDVRGRTGFELVSVPAMARFARERGVALALPAAFMDDGRAMRAELPHFIAASLSSPNPTVRDAAYDVVGRVGRNLGHLLLALHRGDPVNRQARADWADPDWARWASIERVYLAGGLTSGALGDAILRYAAEWLGEVGYKNLIEVQISPYRGLTSLLGAARYLPPGDGYCLAFDFGQTATKRAIVKISGAAIKRLSLLPPVRTPGERPAFPDPDPVETALRHKTFIVNTVCASLEAAKQQDAALPRDVIVCIAAYVDGGRLVGLGGYNSLMTLTSDVGTLLADAIAEQAGHALRVHLIHDGTAAAAAFAGQPHTAIIALGTALGVGFAPAIAEGLLNIDATPVLNMTPKGALTDADTTT